MLDTMSNELLIGLGGLILSGLTYFAGVWRTERRHAVGDRDARVQRVLRKYMEFRRASYTSGLDGLQKAGVATLKSDDEIYELATLITAHGEPNPLGRDHESTFKGVSLHKLFQYAAENRLNFFQIPIEQVIRDSGSKT